MTHGHLLDTAGYPFVIGLDKAQLSHVILTVCIKSRADENHFRFEFIQPGNPLVVHNLTDGFALGIGRYRNVEQVGSFACGALGIKRMLVKAHHQDAIVTAHNVFGAVAMVHIEIDDGDTLQAMTRHGVFGRDGNIVEKTEPHGLVAASMVSGWTHCAKGVFHFPGQHGIHRLHRSACRQQRRPVGAAVHGRVRIQRKILLLTGRNVIFFQPVVHAPHGCNVHAPVRQLDFTQVGGLRLAPLQGIGYTRNEQAIFNRIQPLRTLRMVVSHFVQPAIAVGVITRYSHGSCLQ